LRDGDAVTIVALGQMVRIAAAAAASTADRWPADVWDLETLLPWDRGRILESVKRTGRLIVVEENPQTGGWGTEVVAYVTERAWPALKAPPVRICCPDAPVPFAGRLERRYLPTETWVADQIGALCDGGRRLTPWWEAV
jgi:pyruvate/2-oxoglutarate/acetoin dehydrogenase E1 component